MVAGDDCCTCPECGVVCTGRFRACRDVWDRGLQIPVLVETADYPSPVGARPAGSSDAPPPADAWGAVLQADEDPSPADRADLLTQVAQVVESVVTSVGQRMEEEAGQRLQALLDEINSRLDDLAKEAREAAPAGTKPVRLTVRGGNGKGAAAELPAREQPPSAAG